MRCKMILWWYSCDHPDCMNATDEVNTESSAELRKFANQNGWQIDGNGHFCPEHRDDVAAPAAAKGTA